MKFINNLPNLITFSRFLFGFLMVFFAFFQKQTFFIMIYGFALITDIADGFFARKLKKETKKGKILDILSDNFILVCLFIGFFLLKKRILFIYKNHLLFILAYYFFVQVISFIFTKKLIFKRTLIANISAILFPFVVIFLFFFDIGFFVYPYLILMIYSLSEKLILSLAEDDKKSLYFVKSNKLFLFLLVFFVTIMMILVTNVNGEKQKICFEDNYCIFAEIKDDDFERAQGLMFREHMFENQGMLFIFDNDVDFPFWMKNMKLNIDIIFIDKNKRIVSIIKNATPCNKPDLECELYYSESDYRYVIETIAGFSDKHKLEIGQKVYW